MAVDTAHRRYLWVISGTLLEIIERQMWMEERNKNRILFHIVIRRQLDSAGKIRGKYMLYDAETWRDIEMNSVKKKYGTQWTEHWKANNKWNQNINWEI